MKINRKYLRNMIIKEAKALQAVKETAAPTRIQRATPSDIKAIISEEIAKLKSKKRSRINEGIVEQATGIIRPMIAGPFNSAGYDGDYWADRIIEAVLDAGLDERLISYKLPMLLTDSTARNAIATVLRFNPSDIAEADDPDTAVVEVANNILEVLVEHGYAEEEGDGDTGWW
tara:strand:- start:1036 stop:1554 length:519 start_codon:yes stop_codon:yes gene_type:complete